LIDAAERNMRPKTKTDDYADLYRLNQYFDALAEGIDQLHASGLIAVHSAEARKAQLDEVRARLNSAVARGLEAREAEDLCRFEDLRMEAVRKEAASS
jgi:hypothetical protein